MEGRKVLGSLLNSKDRVLERWLKAIVIRDWRDSINWVERTSDLFCLDKNRIASDHAQEPPALVGSHSWI